MEPQGCNWFWGSHGCDLHSGHTGHHLCGEPGDACSEHDGANVRYNFGGADWGDWSPLSGFCLGDGTPRLNGHGNYAPCGHPDRCEYRENPGHRWA